MGVHDGHRQNLKNEFLISGLEGKTDHQALELLLTYSIPRIDVNPIAHELIERFGSLEGVIEAPPEELIKTKYISENSVVLIKLIPEIFKKYQASKWRKKPVLRSTVDIVDYMRPRLQNERNEVLYMLCFDSHYNLNELVRLSEGTPTETLIHSRTVVEHALRTNSRNVVFAHNHPSGNLNASPQDIYLTNSVTKTLANIGIAVADHIIFAGAKAKSILSELEVSIDNSSDYTQADGQSKQI